MPLWQRLDETVPDDGDYIVGPSPSFEVLLGPLSVPGSRSFHTLYVRAGLFASGRSAVASPGPGRIELRQGATIVAQWFVTVPSDSYESIACDLSLAEASSISDYTDLRATFETTSLNEPRVSWVRMYVPSAVSMGGAIVIGKGGGPPGSPSFERDNVGLFGAADDYLQPAIGHSEDYPYGESGTILGTETGYRYYGESQEDWNAGAVCAVTGVWRAASKLTVDEYGRRVWVGARRQEGRCR